MSGRREDARIGAAWVRTGRAGEADRVRRRAGDRHRHAEDRVRAELRFVRRTVRIDEDLVDLRLVERGRAERTGRASGSRSRRPSGLPFRRTSSCRRRGARSLRARPSTRRSERRRVRDRLQSALRLRPWGCRASSRISRALTSRISAMVRAGYHGRSRRSTSERPAQRPIGAVSRPFVGGAGSRCGDSSFALFPLRCCPRGGTRRNP